MYYQALVTCFLLLDSEQLGVTKVRPEGDEDCDVFFTSDPHADESVVRVQVKFRSGKLSTAELAAALVKAWESSGETDPSRRQIAVCTNRPLSDRFHPRGWHPALTGQIDGANEPAASSWDTELLAAVHAAAASRGLGFDARQILLRAHLLTIGSDPSDLAAEVGRRRSFQTSLHAQLAAGRLLSSVLRAAAANRSATPDTAAVISAHDLEEILRDTAAATGSWLAQIEARQLIALPGFARKPAETRPDYLRGVRAQPQHIGAGYAVSRPRWTNRVEEVLQSGSSALIVGPSGSGKSTIMWLAAYQRTSNRVVVLRRVQDNDVPELSTFLRLMAPSDDLPLLVCADDLDRPALAGWSELLRAVGSDERIRLIGTCREEFFQPGFTASGVARVIRPRLEIDEAKILGIDLRKDHSTHLTHRDLELLHEDSRGLMMEFVCMATSDRWLSEVLDEQASRLLSSRDSVLTTIARTVVAADVCGVALSVTQLRNLRLGDDDVALALARLNAEHIVVEEAGLVRGLHPVRSRHLLRSLHATLPRVSDTLAVLIGLVPNDQIRKVVETWFALGVQDEDLVERALAARIESDTTMTVRAVAELLMRTEASSYAACLRREVSPRDRELIPALLLGRAGSYAAGMRMLTAGIWDSPLGGRQMQEALPRMKRYKEMYEDVPPPRPVRRNVVEALNGRSNWLIDGLEQDRDGIELFAASDAFNVKQVGQLIRACMKIADSREMVPERTYRNGATSSMVFAQNNLWAATLLGAAARTGDAGSEAASRWLGRDPVSRARWLVDKRAVLLSAVLDKHSADSSGNSFLDFELLTPALDIATAELRESFQDTLRDAAVVAGVTYAKARLVTAQNTPLSVNQTVTEPTGWASDRVSQPVLSIFLEQFENLEIERSWFTWLDMVGGRLTDIARALQLSTNAYLEALRGTDNSRTLKRLRDLLISEARLLRDPFPLPPTRRGTDQPNGQTEVSASTIFNPNVALESLGQMLVCLHGVTSMAFEELRGIADSHKLDLLDGVLVLYCGLLKELQIFLNAFRGSTAYEALCQVGDAVEALQSLAFCRSSNLESLKRQLIHVLPTHGAPDRTVRRVNAVTEAFRQAARDRERTLLLQGLSELGSGWDLVSIPVRPGLHKSPLYAWAVITPPLQEVPMHRLDQIVIRVGGLDERVIVVARTIAGSWHEQSYVFADGGGWSSVPKIAHELTVHQLQGQGVHADVKHAKEGTADEELELLLMLLSRRLAQARLLHRGVSDIKDWASDLERLVTQVPPLARDAYSAVLNAVAKEALDSEPEHSLADEMDRYRTGEGFGPLLQTLQRAELLAREDRAKNS